MTFAPFTMDLHRNSAAAVKPASKRLILLHAAIIFAVLNAMGRLRISKEGNIEGLDLHEHGISAYPQYVPAPSAAPAGLPPEAVNAHVAALHGVRGSTPTTAAIGAVL